MSGSRSHYRHRFPLGTARGFGAQGVVYDTHDPDDPEQSLVIKTTPAPIVDTTERARWRREAQLLLIVHHPHLVRLHDWGVDDDQPYLVLELLDGQTLDQAVAHGALPTSSAELADLLLGLVGALRAVHAEGVLVRDLKSKNVMVVERGFVLTDMGLCTSAAWTHVTDLGAVPGSPATMPPEAFGDDPVPTLGYDAYALGVVFYEVVTGTAAFTGPSDESLGEMMARIVRTKLASRELDPGVAAEACWRRLICRLTCSDPAERLTDLIVVEAVLMAIRDGEPTDPLLDAAEPSSLQEESMISEETFTPPPPVEARSERPPWLLPLYVGACFSLLGLGLAATWPTSNGDPLLDIPAGDPIALDVMPTSDLIAERRDLTPEVFGDGNDASGGHGFQFDGDDARVAVPDWQRPRATTEPKQTPAELAFDPDAVVVIPDFQKTHPEPGQFFDRLNTPQENP